MLRLYFPFSSVSGILRWGMRFWFIYVYCWALLLVLLIFNTYIFITDGLSPREVRTHCRWGSLAGLSIFYALGKRELGFQKHKRTLAFFEFPKTFISRWEGWGHSRWGPLQYILLGEPKYTLRKLARVHAWLGGLMRGWWSKGSFDISLNSQCFT